MNTRKQEIKCIVLCTAVFLLAILSLVHEHLSELMLLAIVLFVLAYIVIGVCLDYLAIPKPVEIEMVVIHSAEICTICLEPCLIGIELECGHKFHKKCIQKWTSLKKTCPNCRVSV
jgi:hypothetical protein